MSDQPTVTTDEQHIRAIVREEVAAAVKLALADYPMRTEMREYIDEKISQSNKETNVLIKSIDEHLRMNERTNNQTKTALERVAGTLDSVASTNGMLAKHLDNLQDEVTDQSERITSAHERIDRYAKAVFGDPDTPGVTSLVENFNQRRQEANEQHATTNRRLDDLDKKLDQRIVPLEKYVTSRQQFEANLVRWAHRAFKYRYALLGLVGAVGGGVAVGGIDQLIQFIVNLLKVLQEGM